MVGGHGWGNQELQYYTDGIDNARLDGAGNLQIVVRRTDPQLRDHRFGGCLYTSARLITKDRMAFTYGLVQARIRPPAAAPSLTVLVGGGWPLLVGFVAASVSPCGWGGPLARAGELGVASQRPVG